MKMLHNASREGNDCWINDVWYWCTDCSVAILIRVYDDGRGSEYIRVTKHVDWADVPDEVKAAAHKAGLL